jgi:hypothetical protein
MPGCRLASAPRLVLWRSSHGHELNFASVRRRWLLTAALTEAEAEAGSHCGVCTCREDLLAPLATRPRRSQPGRTAGQTLAPRDRRDKGRASARPHLQQRRGGRSSVVSSRRGGRSSLCHRGSCGAAGQAGEGRASFCNRSRCAAAANAPQSPAAAAAVVSAVRARPHRPRRVEAPPQPRCN